MEDLFFIQQDLEETYQKEFTQIKNGLDKILSETISYISETFQNCNLSNVTLTFEDCFDDIDENGDLIYARCSDLNNSIIDINVYPIWQFLEEEKATVQDILLFYNVEHILEHELAHIIDYQINGDKSVAEHHDEEFNNIFLKILQTVKQHVIRKSKKLMQTF